MSPSYGSQSMVAPLKRVLVKRPDEAFGRADPARWHYTSQPDLALARGEHDALTALLREAGTDVVFHDQPMPGHADAIYVFDPALVTDQGAVLLRMGKDLRRGEEAMLGRVLEDLSIPILYALHGEARAEGGDLLGWMKIPWQLVWASAPMWPGSANCVKPWTLWEWMCCPLNYLITRVRKPACTCSLS